MKHRKTYTAGITMATMFIITAIALMGRAEAAAGNTHPQAQKIDTSLATSVTAAMFGFKEKKLILIDVRTPERYDEFHIPGALNIPLHAIKIKTFLKSKPVVLVNSGFDIVSLAHTCRTLNKDGYRATIMAGGLCAWKTKGGALTGDPFAQRDMNRISARQFHREHASNGKTLVIYLSDPRDDRETAVPANALSLPLTDAREMISRVKAMLSEKNTDPFLNIVLTTTTGEENHRIQKILSEVDLHRQVYLLTGGLQAYQQYVEFGKLARRPKEDRQVSTGGCRSCNR